MAPRCMMNTLLRRGSAYTRCIHSQHPPDIYTPIAQPVLAPVPVSVPKKNSSKKYKRLSRRRRGKVDPVSSEGIINHDLLSISKTYNTTLIPEALIEHYYHRENSRIVESSEIIKVISTGHGVGICSLEQGEGRMIVMVPFTTVGDIVKVKLGRHHSVYAEGEIMSVLVPSSLRDDSLIRCKEFGKCSGCQLQMIPYQEQLSFKTEVVRNAYRQFGFAVDDLPIEGTIASPLQYNYRTKLTPHFGSRRDKITLGFESSGTRRLFDLKQCSIATEVLNGALQNDRDELETIVKKYKKSGTVLLRDKSVNDMRGYTTNHTEVITQQIQDYKFQFPAGEFFQNNNSILPVLLAHIRTFLRPGLHKTVVDTYCGSGFFGISLSKGMERLIGIEISKGSLEFATRNSQLNNLRNAEFLLGSSEEIFKGLDNVDPSETVVILDPSRKGSNHDYLNQLAKFKPSLIVYVSCNVHSQARDLQYLLNNTENGNQYEVSVIRGYDFFPQTKHVESLAVLQLKQ